MYPAPSHQKKIFLDLFGRLLKLENPSNKNIRLVVLQCKKLKFFVPSADQEIFKDPKNVMTDLSHLTIYGRCGAEDVNCLVLFTMEPFEKKSDIVVDLG